MSQGPDDPAEEELPTSLEDAADLVSETFLAAWQSSRTRGVEPDLLRAWLFGIARNVVLEQYRSGSRTTTTDPQAMTAHAEAHHAPRAPDPARCSTTRSRAARAARPRRSRSRPQRTTTSGARATTCSRTCACRSWR